jgi:hypothetical protein
MSRATQTKWTESDLIEVAKCQKHIIWLILISIPAMFFPGATIVTGIIGAYFIYKLAVAVRSSSAWVYIILSLFPIIGLLGLLHISRKATKTLQEHGIRVGLMGARMADFQRIR